MLYQRLHQPIPVTPLPVKQAGWLITPPHTCSQGLATRTALCGQLRAAVENLSNSALFKPAGGPTTRPSLSVLSLPSLSSLSLSFSERKGAGLLQGSIDTGLPRARGFPAVGGARGGTGPLEAGRWGRGNGGGGAGGILTPVSATRSLQSLQQLDPESQSLGPLAARAGLSRARSHGGLYRDLRRQWLRELGRDPLGQGAEAAPGPVPDPRRAAPPNRGE